MVPTEIVPRALSTAGLEVLRREADELYKKLQSRNLAEYGCAFDPMDVVIESLPPSHPVRTNLGAYVAQRFRETGPLAESARSAAGFEEILRSMLAPIACRVLGASTVFLFNEHFVIKPGNSKVEFGWHTDEGEQLPGQRGAQEYVSLWVALDDITTNNGGLVVLEPTGEGECTGGADEELSGNPKLLIVQAGDAVAFSSKLLHCSAANHSDAPRRAYYAQFSREPIRGRHSDLPLCLAIPFD